MMFDRYSLVVLCASMALATISFQNSGWLDRVVQYHKNYFLADLKKIPRVQIKASVERAPYGYVDPTTWDLESVLRLLDLLQHSNVAAPVLQYLRRSMTSRRMKYAETFKAFPSLSKNHPNYFYYDIDSDDYDMMASSDTPPGEISDDSIVVISNPAEARLPAAQISVRLLREILEARAVAARYMPTTKFTIHWKPMNKTTTPAASANTTEVTGATNGDANVTITGVGGNVSETTAAIAETAPAA